MVHLPTEILQPILQELEDEHIRLASLSTVNRHWQGTSESIMWRHLTIHIRDLDHLRRLFHANPERRKALRELLIIYENYFIYSRDENGETRDEEIDDEGSQAEPEHDIDSEPGANEEQGGTTANDGIEKSFEDDKSDEGDSEYEIQQRFSTYRDEQLRVFQETKSIWDELASWEGNLKVTEITLYIKGRSIYELLGPSFMDFGTVQKYFENKSLYFSDTPQLPLLPSVKTLLVLEPANQELDLWPAVVACKIASTLLKLERLEISGTDMDRRWEHMRKQFREELANQVTHLPLSVRTMLLSLEHIGIANHMIEPSNFLTQGADILSHSLNHVSTYLSTLVLRVNHISPALFWNSEVSSSQSHAWPSLRVIDIITGFETAEGKYWMRSLDNFPAQVPHIWYENMEVDLETYESDEVSSLDIELGYWPARLFRLRPEPEFFNELAVSIARAAACMSELLYVNLEFDALHRDSSKRSYFNRDFRYYDGWGFYFRASNEVRFASKYKRSGVTKPGPDFNEIPRPRTEWVFQCPYRQVQWQEPDEAKTLWGKKFPHGIDHDLVTLDRDEEGHHTWERRREGQVIASSTWSVENLQDR